MSAEQSESTPAAQVEAKAAPAADITQQAMTPTATTQRKKDPKCVAAGKAASEKMWLAREQQKKDAEAYRALQKNKAKASTDPPEPAPDTKEKTHIAAASAPTNGSLLAVLEFPFSGSITSVKSSWQWPSPCSTNSKCRSPRQSP